MFVENIRNIAFSKAISFIQTPDTLPSSWLTFFAVPFLLFCLPDIFVHDLCLFLPFCSGQLFTPSGRGLLC
jgi:hypothetical protein